MEDSELFTRTVEVIYRYGEAVADLYKRMLEADDKKASGNLIQSVQAKVAVTSMGLEYVVYLELADYWKYVEKGLRGEKNHTSKYRAPEWRKAFPHILNWIRIKPVLPRPLKNGKLPTEKQLAAMISRGIERNGIEAGNQLRNAVEIINRTYLPQMQEALRQDWDEYAVSINRDINRMVRI